MLFCCKHNESAPHGYPSCCGTGMKLAFREIKQHKRKPGTKRYQYFRWSADTWDGLVALVTGHSPWDNYSHDQIQFFGNYVIDWKDEEKLAEQAEQLTKL